MKTVTLSIATEFPVGLIAALASTLGARFGLISKDGATTITISPPSPRCTPRRVFAVSKALNEIRRDGL